MANNQQSKVNMGDVMNQNDEVGDNPQQGDGAENFFQEMMSMGSSDQFIKGLLIGAGVTYLMSNEKVQQKMVKTVVQGWTMMQGGMEEMKERFRDAEAEIQAEQEISEG